MEHDRREDDANSHSVAVDDMDRDDTEDEGTNADDTNMSETADSFIVSPEAQEYHQPAGHSLSDESHSGNQIYPCSDWRPCMRYAYAALQRLAEHLEIAGHVPMEAEARGQHRDRVTTLETRADDTDICLNRVIDTIEEHAARLPTDPWQQFKGIEEKHESTRQQLEEEQTRLQTEFRSTKND